MSKKSISKEELETVQGMLREFNNLKTKLGDLELSKQRIIKTVEVLQEKYLEVEKDLTEKYGSDAIINVQNGEIEEASKEKVDT